MPAAVHNDWVLEEGSPFQKTLVWKSDDGSPIDISGWDARMDIREKRDPTSTSVLDVDGGGWITITDGPAGEFTIDIPASETEALGYKSGEVFPFDIELDDGSGSPGRVLQGAIQYSREVTA